MRFLRDRWLRSPLHRYFADLEPVDRATAYIVIALLLAWTFAFGAIVRASTPAPAPVKSPRFTAPPLELRFAALVRSPS